MRGPNRTRRRKRRRNCVLDVNAIKVSSTFMESNLFHTHTHSPTPIRSIYHFLIPPRSHFLLYRRHHPLRPLNDSQFYISRTRWQTRMTISNFHTHETSHCNGSTNKNKKKTIFNRLDVAPRIPNSGHLLACCTHGKLEFTFHIHGDNTLCSNKIRHFIAARSVVWHGKHTIWRKMN